MARREMKVDAVAFITKEGFPCLFRFQDAGFALYSKLILNSAMAGNQTHHAFAKMGVEIVADNAPLAFLEPIRGGVQKAVEKGGEILLGARIADCLIRTGFGIDPCACETASFPQHVSVLKKDQVPLVSTSLPGLIETGDQGFRAVALESLA